MTPAGTTHYVYDLAGHLIAEATDTGTTVREYVWLDDMPLAVVADVDTMTPHLYYVHADHLDRPLRMTDATEAVVWDAVYKPFGEVVSITGSASNNLRFPGQYFLIESGLHYNWYRHYDATLGRYTQPDPLGFVDGPSVFAYGKSAPGMYVDKDGRFVWWALPAAFAAADLGWQLYHNGGQFGCVSWGEVLEVASWGLGASEVGLNAMRAAGLDFGAKIIRQMATRGWTRETVREAVEAGTQIKAINKATGNDAVRYVHPETGKSVVVDSKTNEVIHVGGPGFDYGPGSGDVP